MKPFIVLCLVFVLGAHAASHSHSSSANSHPHSNSEPGSSAASSVPLPVSVQNVPVDHVAQPHGVVSNSAGVVEPSIVVSQGVPQPVASHYAPAGIVQVVGGSGQGVAGGAQKPGAVSSIIKSEQYGQPESAAVPPHYKPFGSWGLYIGGNPADGYYTNYYKSLSSSVEKAQGISGDKPIASTVSAVNPILKQASTSPYQGADYYPFLYSASDFSANQPQFFGANPAVLIDSHPAPVVGVGNGNFAAPSSYIPEMYATKRVGGAKGEIQQQQQQQQAPTKSVKSTAAVYYAAPVSGAVQSATVAPQSGQPQQQVVAYPVPIGSQIIGSQVGVDGAFYPYGVHAFTKYAVKPTVVGVEQYGQQAPAPVYQAGVYSPSQLSVIQPVSYKYGSAQAPAYYSPSSYQAPSYVPASSSYLSYYSSFPTVGNLHYSNGPAVHGHVEGSPTVDDEDKVVGSVKPIAKRS